MPAILTDGRVLEIKDTYVSRTGKFMEIMYLLDGVRNEMVIADREPNRDETGAPIKGTGTTEFSDFYTVWDSDTKLYELLMRKLNVKGKIDLSKEPS